MNIIKTVTLALLITACLGLFAARVAYPWWNGYEVATIRTPSMLPNLAPGSVVYIDPNAPYSIGDVVTFGTPSGIYLTHRIVRDWSGTGAGPFATQGDANDARDTKLINRNAILGRAVAMLPAPVGWITEILSIVPVMMFALVLVLTILLWPIIVADKPQVIEGYANPSQENALRAKFEKKHQP